MRDLTKCKSIDIQVEHAGETIELCYRIEARTKLMNRIHVIEQLGLSEQEFETLVSDKPIEFSALIEKMIGERWNYFAISEAVRGLL